MQIKRELVYCSKPLLSVHLFEEPLPKMLICFVRLIQRMNPMRLTDDLLKPATDFA